AIPADLAFLPLAAAWLVALIARRTAFRWHRGYWLLLLYFGAMAASALVSADPPRSAAKLLTQAYLLSLTVLASNLVRDAGDLRMVARSWLAATAVIALVAVASLVLFVVVPASPLLDYTRFPFGTLPPGDYPRLQLTFRNANMLCNYLTVSLALLLASAAAGWIRARAFALILGGIGLSAAFTISPGLGGIALLGATWLWLLLRDRHARAARLALAAGIAAALLFVGATAATPILHPTAPFLIHVPGFGMLAPSGRLMVWIEAARTFAAHPLLGVGIGVDPVHVRYVDPSGNAQLLTDAHNSYLSIAAQCGLVGLAALLVLIGYALRLTLPLRLSTGKPNAVRLALGLGFANALAYQGLGGSFEDARHLWVLLGLLLAASRIEAERRAPEHP
ncbi:MAG: O-antigen ligase family protein, partial [Sphingomonadales bacterium]